jgi:predicted phage terminase large subunit-like protein
LNQSLPKLSDIKCELARRDFWEFCKLTSPEFYRDDRPHLKSLCNTLQDFYEDNLDKPNLIIEMPPRHGKSRTLVNFTGWILGKDQDNKILTASFNDDLAQEFSRYTRDLISEEKNLAEHIVYSDIFPGVTIKRGDASYKKWALEGKFFSYKGTGIGGSVTGRGGNFLITDDPVKDAETAYNPAALEKIWLWYSGTFISRAEEGAKQIVCMTPWAKGDLTSKLVSLEPEHWHIVRMPAFDGEKMLCSDLLSKESYDRLKKIGDESIISANYDLKRLDIKGRLYSGFKTYSDLPEDTTGNVGYTDTADEGKDYLCSLQARKKGIYLYVTNVQYTQEAQEKTEGELVRQIEEAETRDHKVESNNGGRGFARNIQRILEERGIPCSISWFHQSKNKQSRILTNAPTVQSTVLFPEDWATRWPAFYNSLMTYQKEGKNKHDDGPDALTGLVEHFGANKKQVFIGRA